MSKVVRNLDGMLGAGKPETATTIQPPGGAAPTLHAVVRPRERPEARAALNIDIPVSMLDAVRALARDRDVRIRDIVIQGIEIVLAANAQVER